MAHMGPDVIKLQTLRGVVALTGATGAAGAAGTARAATKGFSSRVS